MHKAKEKGTFSTAFVRKQLESSMRTITEEKNLSAKKLKQKLKCVDIISFTHILW